MLTSFLEVGRGVAVLFILIGVGALMTKLNLITKAGASSMTDVVLYAVTPCVIINAFQREYRPELLGGLLISLASAFVIMGLSILLAELMYRKKASDKAVVLKFTLVFSNCGFMALPLQEAVLGEDGVFYGAAYIAMFNLLMWTYGIIRMSGRSSLGDCFKAALNPGVIGTLIGVLLFVFSVELPDIIYLPVKYLAALNTPVPMLVIGYHLMNSNLKSALGNRSAYFAMAMRLIILPLAAMGVMLAIGVDSIIICSTVIAVSSPVAVITTMLAAKYGRDAELSTGIVSASSIFSLITMPLVVGLSKYLCM